MSSTRKKRIDEIFTGALEISGKARDEFLNEQCQDDAELKQQVQELLDAAEDPENILDTQFGGIRDRLLRSVFDDGENASEDLSGNSIDGWRLEKRLARGGLATVYLAHRDDGEFNQKAAFKVLRRGLDTDDLVSRFRAERQMLSTLEHPAIARIFDGGAMDDGRPYLVLEFVDGVPITAYADANELSVRDKVILIIRVLRALHHAHTHLVVHRDVKPSNILVKKDGTVSLLDFGIAKLLDPEAMPGASTMTKTGVSLLTPGYGSPEQHAGALVTTASDIYQAGVVLYEMLTGKRPYDTGADPDDTVALVPSRKLRGKPDFPKVRGDLDAIVRKATHGDPALRYASADEMVSDLRRYLDGLPVTAQPDSVGYRLSKLAKRRPWLLPVAGLVVAGIAAYVATITIYSQRLAREEQLAATSQQFLIDLFKSSDPLAPADPERGSNITVVEALDLGRERINNELSGQPALRASLLTAISQVYDSLDQDLTALEMRREALELERNLYGERSPQVVASLRALSGLVGSAGDQEAADEMVQRQLELARQLYSENSPELGLAEVAAGIHANAAGRLEESHKLLKEGIEKLRPARLEHARHVIAALIISAEQHGMEVPNDAFAAIAEAEDLAKTAFGEGSLQAAHVQIRLASSLTIVGEYEESERIFMEALPVLEERLGGDHSYSISSLNNFGYLYTRSGDLEKAEPIHRELLERNLRLYGPQHRAVADSYQNLGGTIGKLGRFAEAVPLHREAYAIYSGLFNDDHYMIAFPLLSIAYAELQQQNSGAAEKAASEALQRFHATVPGTFLEGVAQCLVGLALEQRGDTVVGTPMVLASHELMKTGSIPDPYPALCRLPGS